MLEKSPRRQPRNRYNIQRTVDTLGVKININISAPAGERAPT